jgi:asparagine synthase (glutamine-hydrolysing)
MCGIFAVRDPLGRGGRQHAERALAALHHRGPDARRVWESADRTITLGHTRLSIIDLETGDQPISNEDGSIHLIVNGEFYDFEDIREQLESRGHRFRTRSDSEILAHLYEEHGVECVNYLRGEYAFVLWDDKQQRVFAGRDRFGVKPLHFAQHAGRLLFASEAKALHAAGVPAEWDEEGFFEHYAFTFTGPRTLFRGIETLRPGCFLLANGTDYTVHRYWDWNFPIEQRLPERSPEQYAEEFGALLDDAVRTRMRADVPVGCYLSGGIDSCSVLALMAKHATRPVRAFSLSFDHELYNEAAIAREMADKAGAEIELIGASQKLIARDLADAVWHAETMFINGGSAAKFSLSRAVREAGYKVVLTGEGADEVLAGYPFFRADLIRYGGSSASLESLTGANGISRGLLLPHHAVPIRSFVDRIGYVPAMFEARQALMREIQPALRNTLDGEGMFQAFLERIDVAGQVDGRNVLSQSLYLCSKTALPGYVLVALGDRVEMGHSVEARLPFLDHKVVEYARQLPVTQKIHDGVEKYVLREAMKPLLPETVYHRQKHPFLSPPALMKPGEPLHELMQDTLRGPAVDRVPFFRREGIAELLDKASTLDDAGKTALEFPVMQMLTACLLAEKFRL